MPENKVNNVNKTNNANTALFKNRKTVLSTNAQMSMTDFYKIMAAQLKYQDPSNPADSSDMLNQMTQMSMISSIENMNTMIMTSYTTSMMGKEVTIAVRKKDSNEVEEVKGIVTGVNLSGRQPTVWVNGKEYFSSQIMQIGNSGKAPEAKDKDKDKGTGKNNGSTGGTTGSGGTTGGTTGTPGTGGTTGSNNNGSSGNGGTSGTTPPPTTSTGSLPGGASHTSLINGALSGAEDLSHAEAIANASSEDTNIGEKLAPVNAVLRHISATGTDAENAMPPMTIIEDNGVEEKVLPKYNEQENKSKIITPVG